MKLRRHYLYLIFFLFITLFVSTSVFASNEYYEIKSPDNKLIFNLYKSNSDIEYSVSDSDGYVWINNSPLEIVIDRVLYYISDSIVSCDVIEKTDSYSHLGNFSETSDRYNLAKISFNKDGYLYFLDVAVFDDGVAFRYVLPDMGITLEKTTDHTTFVLNENVCECWYGVNNTSCEAEILCHAPLEKSKDDIFFPITAVMDDGKYISIMEADVSSSFGGTTVRSRGSGTFRVEYLSVEARNGETISPWRVINVANNLNDLVNNNNIYTLCASPNADTFENSSWIVPGRSVWSWGVTQGSPSVGQMKDYTEYASKLGFEYNIIDDGWPRWDEYKSKLRLLGELGDKLNVRQIVWCAVTEGTEGKNKIDSFDKIDSFFKMIKECGIDGVKADFWWNESESRTGILQNYFLSKAAESKMVVDLHGCCKNSGTDRTYPNELTREGIRGLEHIGASCRTRDNEMYSKLLTTQLFTRYLSGHGDWTPTVDSAMEIGSVICIDSPLMSIASDPSDIYNSDAREFIKSIPTVWDRTVVLSFSKIGEIAAFAKESAGVWFVGGVYSSTSDCVCVNLSEFLPEGISFFADIWDDYNGKMTHTRKNVTSSDVIQLSDKSFGTGFAIRLSPIELSVYGGEILENLEVSCADSGDVIIYTIDGSDPLSSETALIYTGPIRIQNSCTLTVAVTEKASISCNFNILTNVSEECEEIEIIPSFEMWKKKLIPFRLQHRMFS